MKHLKRLKAPRTWSIERKVATWTVRPSPGPHAISKSIPLLLVIRDYLDFADSGREAKKIISAREISVDGIPRQDYKFPCGLMDVISIPKMEKHYRILFNNKGILKLVEIDEERAQWKLCRIENKKNVKGNKVQLNLHDGKNILSENTSHKTGDVLQINIPSQEIKEVISFEKDTLALIIGGRHVGEVAKIAEITTTKSPMPNVIQLQDFSTIKRYVFPIGKEQPVVQLPGVEEYGN